MVSISRAAEEIGCDRETLKKAITRKQVRVVELASRQYLTRKEISRLLGEEQE